MQVILKPLATSDGSPIVIETTPQDTVATLISSYCAQKGIAYDSKLVLFDGKKRPLPPFSTLASLGITNGQNLMIGASGKSFQILKEWPLIVAFAAIIIGIIGILTMSMVYGLTGGIYIDDYGVVMDAGSSKTNTILYKWKSNKHKGTGCVSQAGDCYAKGGIAKMDPMNLSPVINCAKKVTSIVDVDLRPKTPLFFAATAGMRLLNLTNPTRVNQILEQLDLKLNETGLPVKAIEIIQGRDEGVYGWITANFLRQTLEIQQKFDPWVPTTYGALDMGGASTQIAYALPSAEPPNSTDLVSLKLYGQTHNVFSYSNLCFGRDEASRRYRLFLIQDPTKDEIYDPCIPKGFKKSFSGEEIFNQPCTHSNKAEEIKNNNKEILGKNFTFIGGSNYTFCQNIVSKLLDNDMCNNMKFKECFRKLEDPPGDQKYLAFATYFYTTNFLNVTKSSLEEYEIAVQNFCNKNYSEVVKITDSDYVTEYCFNAQYMYQVLINGFGFRNTTWPNIEFVGEIAGKDVGWTLGYMINATNLLPEKGKTQSLISGVHLTVSLVIFLIIIIFTVLYLLYSYRKKNGTSPTTKLLP